MDHQTCLDKQSASIGQKLYWPQLDGLRALAFLIVFSSHLGAIPIPKDTSAGLAEIFKFLTLMMSWGWLGVQLFFLLSGFLITTLFLEERKRTDKISFSAFFARRALRIWPLYYIFLFINFILMPGIFHHGHFGLGKPAWWNMCNIYFLSFSMFLGNFALAAHEHVDVPFSLVIAWSICVEEHFYMLWGILFSKIRSASILWWAVLAFFPIVFLIRLWCYAASPWFGTYYFNTLAQMDPFLAGTTVAFLHHGGKLNSAFFNKAVPGLFWLAILYYGLLTLYAPNLDRHQYSMVIIYLANSIFGAGFLIALLCWKPAAHFFSQPLPVKWGRLTYGMYLFHVLAIWLAQTFLRPWMPAVKEPFSWLVFNLSALILTALMAVLSWQMLEKRFLALRKIFVKVPSGSY